MTLFSDIARFTTILLTIFLVNKYNYNTNFLIIVIKLYSMKYRNALFIGPWVSCKVRLKRKRISLIGTKYKNFN
jgi:hypothetical protein